MATSTYTVQVDWGNNGVWTDAGDDITARVLSLEWSRGRDYASQLTGRSTAGSLMIRFDNSSGDYSSFNAASPLAGNILPGRKVRIQGGSGSFPYTFPIVFNDNPLWQGFLTRLVPEPSLHNAHVVILEAMGPLGYLNQRQIELAMATNILTSVAISNILDAVGWPAGDRTIAVGQTTMTRFWEDRKATLEAMRDVEETEAGFLTESKDGKVVFQDRHYRLSGDPLTSQATFSDAAAAPLSYSHIEQADPLPNIFNILESNVQLYTVGGLAVLWTLAESGASSPLIERGSGTLTFWAYFPNPDSAVDAWGVDAWTTPVATTDFLVNTAADGSGTNITASVSVAVTKFGNSMKITLTNANAADGYVTLLQARGTPLTANDPITVREEDATSKTAYGERTYPNPGKFLPDSVEARDWALYHLGIYKDPVPVLAITVNANRSEAQRAQVFTRNIGDRITVVNNNLGINRDFFIEAEHHRVDAHKNHWCTWELSDATQFSDWWVLDTSALDSQTRLAY